MADSVKVKVTKTGRVRGPNLSDPQLRVIGEAMVTTQKDRWGASVNASGQLAKQLARRYAIIKQAVLHKRPSRDMVMTGQTKQNFTLRKAADNRIRAENTTVLCRQKALRANSYDQMIGFAVTDAKIVFMAAQVAYGDWVKKAWIPISGTNRRPSTLNTV